MVVFIKKNFFNKFTRNIKVSGIARPYEILAILGSSGSGW